MATRETYAAGILIERWDSALGYTHWDATGKTVTTQRALTAPEAASLTAADAAMTAVTNADTLRQRATAALATNNTYVAIASPTTAQAVTQVKVLTKECSAVIRLLLNQLDDITGT